MSIDADFLEKKLEDMNGNIEEIKALNETITEFIDDVQDMKTNTDVKLLNDRAYRVVYFAHIINEKANLLQSEIEKIIPCLQTS